MITLPTFIVLIVIAGIFCLLPTITSLCAKSSTNEKLSKIGLLLFILTVLSLTLFSTSFNLKVTTINFKPCSNWFNQPFNFKFWKFSINDFLINILMFCPLGIILTQNAKAKNSKSLKWCLLVGFILSLTIEILQAILPFNRFPSLSDVIFNTLSAGIGCIFLNLCHKIKNHATQKNYK